MASKEPAKRPSQRASAKTGPARPVLDVLDLLGRRWAMRIVWELRRDARGFAELRDRLGLSPSVLSTRLRELASAGIVERDGEGRYRLTGGGRDLARLLLELNSWAERSYARSGEEP